MTRILALGGTGSIGRLVVARLAELGDDVRVLTREPSRAERTLGSRVDLVAGDLSDVSSVAAALDEVDAVVLTHGAPYGSSRYESIDYGAMPALLAALDGREVRIALMSSIGVTKTGGSVQELLSWKRRGERLLRSSGLAYTIVRPGWFDAGTGREQRIELRQGDLTDYGPVQRTHVAETLVSALTTPAAVGRTVEVFSVDGPPADDWQVAFGATLPDMPGSLDGVRDRPGLPLDSEPERVRNDLRQLGAKH